MRKTKANAILPKKAMAGIDFVKVVQIMLLTFDIPQIVYDLETKACYNIKIFGIRIRIWIHIESSCRKQDKPKTLNHYRKIKSLHESWGPRYSDIKTPRTRETNWFIIVLFLTYILCSDQAVESAYVRTSRKHVSHDDWRRDTYLFQKQTMSDQRSNRIKASMNLLYKKYIIRTIVIWNG